jgi:branched-chain amino acid aminotransferase
LLSGQPGGKEPTMQFFRTGKAASPKAPGQIFFSHGERVYTPPRGQVLEGVTKITLSEALQLEGIPVEEKELRATEVPSQQGIFLTSTSTKVMPLRKLGLHNLTISPLISDMKVDDGYQEEYGISKDRLF